MYISPISSMLSSSNYYTSKISGLSDMQSIAKRYEEFKANVISSHIDDISEIDRILSGRCLLHTITSGFIWSCTDEGDDIWHERHVEFRKWFNS